MMNFAALKKAEDDALGASLKASGFQRIAAGTWNRRVGDELNVIQLQPHSVEQSFCVNLGIHYMFLPKAGTEAPLDGDQIDIHDCELKLRLTDESGTSDKWWPMSASKHRCGRWRGDGARHAGVSCVSPRGVDRCNGWKRH